MTEKQAARQIELAAKIIQLEPQPTNGSRAVLLDAIRAWQNVVDDLERGR